MNVIESNITTKLRHEITVYSRAEKSESLGSRGWRVMEGAAECVWLELER